MTFSDPETHARRSASGSGRYATIEVGRASTVNGIMVQVDARSVVALRAIVEAAFDLAWRQPRRQVSDPGWWALMLGWAGLQVGEASVQRSPTPGRVHAVLVIEPARRLESFPLWPLVRFGPHGTWVDCRGEAEPADAELVSYAAAAGVDAPLEDLRRMFEMGVLEWGPLPLSGRRSIVPSGGPGTP